MLALVPCKNLNFGKSRLAEHLDPDSRRSLCEFLLHSTLELIAEVFSPDSVRLVTPDARAAAIGLGYGIRHIEDGGCGLNQALSTARAVVLNERPLLSRALIFPIDLPYATASSLEQLLNHQEDVVIVPDRAKSATNAMVLTANAFPAFSFAFGRGSYHVHLSQARHAGQSVRSVVDERLTFDLDRPCEYDQWIGDRKKRASSCNSLLEWTSGNQR